MLDIIAQAWAYRKLMEQATRYIPDELSEEYIHMFPEYDPNGHDYKEGDRFTYEGVLYKVTVPHISQPDWKPDSAHGIYSKVLTDPTNSPVEWNEKDLNATNCPMKGDLVIHKGHLWESVVDNNSWEPGAIGTETLWIDKGPYPQA